MIVGAFLSILLSALTFIVGLLPVIAFPTQITSAFLTIWGYVNLFSMVIPVGTLVTIIGLSLTYEVTKLLWKLVHWIMRRVRH